MHDPNKVAAERDLRACVRQTLQHVPLFALEHELPDAMCLLLDRLEQVNATPAERALPRPATR